jgi:acyl carrier protein
VPDRTTLLNMFRSKASEVAEKDFSHVTEQSVIAELGIDSLGMLELIGELERDLEIRLSDEQLTGIRTVRELLDVVERQSSLNP